MDKYNWVIVLHNEYVTQSEFDALTHHKNVLYLYPNSLYALIKYQNGSITLLRGHTYIVPGNGFNWKYDISQSEFNTACKDWKMIKIENGLETDCNPKLLITQPSSLKYIKDITLS